MKPKAKKVGTGPELVGSELHWAARDNDVEGVRRLLTPANLESVIKGGMTPLHVAAESDRALAADAVRVLIDAGANLEAEDGYGRTPLWLAVFNSRGHGEIIRLLRDAGADPFHVLPGNTTAVKEARIIANFDVAQFFADLP